ncbi:hypothetical protein PFWH6_3301 [Pseudomonas fluorescens WH6]|nr:hypothetical protein PFWH6_3301 [Pseudomonas fluorescens WH6]
MSIVCKTAFHPYKRDDCFMGTGADAVKKKLGKAAKNEIIRMPFFVIFRSFHSFEE